MTTRNVWKTLLFAAVVLASAFSLSVVMAAEKKAAGVENSAGAEELLISKVPAVVWTEGRFGKGVRFDWVGGRVTCSNTASLNMKDAAVSIAFWIKGKGFQHDGEFVSKPKAYEIMKRGISNGGIYFWINGRDVIWPVDMFKLEDNVWTHIAFVFDAKKPLAKAYLNGKLMATKETFPYIPGVSGLSGINSTESDLVLGAGGAPGGCLDEVYIYNRALGDEEIANVCHNENISKEGLAGLWKFEEGNGATAADLSGNGNTGCLSRILVVDGELAKIKEESDVLAGLVQKAESGGNDVAGQKISLNTIKCFVDFIKVDAKDERLEKVVLFELTEVRKMLKRAVKETEEMIKSPVRRAAAPAVNLKELTVKDGAFYCGNRPVFLSGFYVFSPETIKVQKSLGANLFGPINAPNPSEFMDGWDKIREDKINETVLPNLKMAEEENMLMVPMLMIVGIPSWLEKEAPGLDRQTSRTISVNIDHPLLNRLIDCYAEAAGKCYSFYPSSTNKANNFCFALAGEEEVSSRFVTEYTADRYEQWLREKYGAVEKLNAVWNTTHKSFKDAAEPEVAEAKIAKSMKNRASFYDWHSFNQWRLTAYYDRQVSALRKANPDVLVSRWTSGLLTKAGAFNRHLAGVDIEKVVTGCSISGWDGGIVAHERPECYARSKEDCLGWKGEMRMSDFAKSVAPGQPIFNPEWHSVSECTFR